MEISIKKFYDLTHDQLFDIFYWRQEVYTVEQSCTENDMDEYDKISHHVLIYVDSKLASYCRIVPAGSKFVETSIGRVITPKGFRGQGLAHKLMEAAIDFIISQRIQDIRISAQAHLEKFYAKHGFIKVGAEYLESDIPHIEMIRRNS
jgi:ElaA protein